MSKIKEDLKYTNTHEWAKIENGIATIGITDFASHSLGTIVYVESYDLEEDVSKGHECGAVESVKAASDIMAPVSGKIIAINEMVIDEPGLLNIDAYENWIIKIEISDEAEINDLLDAASYEKVAH